MAGKENKGLQYDAQTVGRRKSSVARVYVVAGSGKIIINKRDIRDYFPKATNRYIVNQPLSLLKKNDQFDIKINVKGGGNTGQAGAIRLGIARAMAFIDGASRPELKTAGFLCRDARKVERKKPGLRGARAKFQFSKR
jgi:small subunit ribosomal protein S9